jgi:hypothetical protein
MTSGTAITRISVLLAIKLALTAETVEKGDFYDRRVASLVALADLSPLDLDQLTAVAIAELHICRGGDTMIGKIHQGDCEYVSECCEGLPIDGELDLSPVSGIVGVCQGCREIAEFVCIECEDAENDTGG